MNWLQQITLLHYWIVFVVFMLNCANHTNHLFWHFSTNSAIHVLKSFSSRFLTVHGILSDFQSIQDTLWYRYFSNCCTFFPLLKGRSSKLLCWIVTWNPFKWFMSFLESRFTLITICESWWTFAWISASHTSSISRFIWYSTSSSKAVLTGDYSVCVPSFPQHITKNSVTTALDLSSIDDSWCLHVRPFVQNKRAQDHRFPLCRRPSSVRQQEAENGHSVFEELLG
jgi:hypothetical protein